jgi:hypothetical protein
MFRPLFRLHQSYHLYQFFFHHMSNMSFTHTMPIKVCQFVKNRMSIKGLVVTNELYYSETSIYHSWIIRFPGSVVQFLWSLSEFYLNYGSRIYCFPGSIVSFSDPRWKRFTTVHFTVFPLGRVSSRLGSGPPADPTLNYQLCTLFSTIHFSPTLSWLPIVRDI